MSDLAPVWLTMPEVYNGRSFSFTDQKDEALHFSRKSDAVKLLAWQVQWHPHLANICQVVESTPIQPENQS